ncbi:MAG: VacJ family lipoprotein [Thalassobaculaceae bacterium]|nr:VacJ family lipoprotein [Thalassobaculaceae bacterium]
MRRVAIGTSLALFMLAGCASQGEQGDGAVYDPIEPANRLVFAMNDAVDTMVLQPTAYVYKEVIPAPIREVVRNFLDWLSSPLYIANSALQGDLEGLEHNASRFVANSPMFGLVDNATGLGLERRPEDFGQTLAVWGADDGPYLVLPLIGPSNLRDTTGLVADYFMDPINYIGGDEDARFRYQIARKVVGAVDFRAQNFAHINDLKATSVDYYARVRTIYKQRREALIRNNTPASASASGAESSGEFEEFQPTNAPIEQSGKRSSD